MRLSIITIVLLLTVPSCAQDDVIVKRAIEQSQLFIGVKMSDVERLDEDLWSVPMHYTLIDDRVQVVEGNNYEVARYIFKTSTGVSRMFYIVDVTEKTVVAKSSNPDKFYLPLMSELLSLDESFLLGDNTIALMRM